MSDHGLPEAVAQGKPKPLEADVDDRLLAFADRLRRSDEDEIQEEQPEVWVSFRLAQRQYALPVTHVREYAPVGKITRVPGAPAVVCGVASLRGHAIPVVDLKKVLGLSDGPSRGDDHVLVVEQRGRVIGLLVDGIDEIVKLLPRKIKDASSVEEAAANDRILGLYESDELSLVLLSADTFLSQQVHSDS
jgi:chemotaxis signal transduction protein